MTEFKPEDFARAILSRLQCEHVALIANAKLRELLAKACGALAQYGEHDPGCAYPTPAFPRKPCSCGFAQVLKELDDALSALAHLRG